MKTKSIFLVALTAFITAVIVQNNESIAIKVLWESFEISKLVLFSFFFISGLIVGLMISWGSGKKNDYSTASDSTAEEDKSFLFED